MVAGDRLQRCRTRFLRAFDNAHDVLLIGEGHGRFLEALVQSYPHIRVTCVDQSAAMLRATQQALQKRGQPLNQVQFVQADVFDWLGAESSVDAIATHFFLDCFREDQLQRLIPRLTSMLKPGGQWVVSDFAIPSRGWRRWRAQLLLWAAYRVFRVTTQLPARRLVEVQPLFCAAGLTREEREEAEWGLLYSERWTAPHEPVTSAGQLAKMRSMRSDRSFNPSSESPPPCSAMPHPS